MKSIIPVGVVPNILVPLCERIIFWYGCGSLQCHWLLCFF